MALGFDDAYAMVYSGVIDTSASPPTARADAITRVGKAVKR